MTLNNYKVSYIPKFVPLRADNLIQKKKRAVLQ